MGSTTFKERGKSRDAALTALTRGVRASVRKKSEYKSERPEKMCSQCIKSLEMGFCEEHKES